MVNDKADNVIDEPFLNHFILDIKSTKKKMKGSSFIFNHIHLLYYKCHKVNSSCSESYIDSPGCIKNKNITISHANNDDKYYQYATTNALLIHEEI